MLGVYGVPGGSFVGGSFVGGSFVGGLLGYVLFNKDFDEGALQVSGIIGSIVGAVIALLVYRSVSSKQKARV